MTRRNNEADAIDKMIREGETWWSRLLRDAKISIPNAIMLFLVTWTLWVKMDNLQRSMHDRWSGRMTVDLFHKMAWDNPTLKIPTQEEVRAIQKSVREDETLP